jgi:deoxyribodipyrimidine photo-lyase
VASYFDTRNGLLGADFSTKLSAWLAHGCISPRRVHSEVLRYEAERTVNKSTYWVLFEMMTRDYYK